MNMSHRNIASRILVVLMLVGFVVALGTPLVAQQQQQPQPSQQNEFVPLKDLPQQEQIPAAPLVMAAYAFVWVVLIVYVWFLWRRVGAVHAELADLRKRTGTRR